MSYAACGNVDVLLLVSGFSSQAPAGASQQSPVFGETQDEVVIAPP